MTEHTAPARLFAAIALAGVIGVGATRAEDIGPDLPPADGATMPALIEHALRRSAGPRVADRNVTIARQRAIGGDAAFRPHLNVGVTETRETLNPAALGFQFPGQPSLLGPFNVFDARLRLSQVVLDLAQISTSAAAHSAVRAAQAQADLDREQLASDVASAFIRVLVAQANLTSAEADLGLAMDLDTLARDRRAAGITSGMDVIRAQTAVAQSRYAVSEAQTVLARSRLQLQGLGQLPLDPAALNLSGELAVAADGGALATDAILEQARRNRPELALIDATLAEAEALHEQARRRRLPSLSAFADYGLSATTPQWEDQNTYRIGAQLSLPIYSGGSLQADIAATELRVEQQRLRLAALRRQVEEDVLLAAVTVNNTREQVLAAEATLALAQRELESARDRFQQGVADNLDVVTAQASFARARSQLVNAQGAQQLARLNLAAATGHARRFHL